MTALTHHTEFPMHVYVPDCIRTVSGSGSGTASPGLSNFIWNSTLTLASDQNMILLTEVVHFYFLQVLPSNYPQNRLIFFSYFPMIFSVCYPKQTLFRWSSNLTVYLDFCGLFREGGFGMNALTKRGSRSSEECLHAGMKIPYSHTRAEIVWGCPVTVYISDQDQNWTRTSQRHSHPKLKTEDWYTESH